LKTITLTKTKLISETKILLMLLLC